MDRVVGPIFLQRICRNSHTDLNVCGVGYDFLIWSFEETQRLTSIGARRNSASRFYWRSKKLSVSLLLALEETQRLASIGARQVLGQAVSLEYFKMFDYNVF
ncbi:hypothetical protein LEP1GSC074_2216 [Leptospira noguchii str. Hook]|nr:hypothetical protein LEP1GSC074_2216 [Leptospira noguchii str. Hook]